MAQLAPVGMGLGLLGTALSTKANVDALDEQARLSEFDSRAKLAEAESIRNTAAFEERQYGRRARLIQGRGVAQAAASGLSIKSGTPLFLELDNIKQAALGKLDILRRGELAAQGREMESAFALRKADYARRAKSGVIGQGVLRGGTILASFLAAGGAPGFGAASSTPSTSFGASGSTFQDPTTGIFRDSF